MKCTKDYTGERFFESFKSYFKLQILSGIQILKIVGVSAVRKAVLATLTAATVSAAHPATTVKVAKMVTAPLQQFNS